MRGVVGKEDSWVAFEKMHASMMCMCVATSDNTSKHEAVQHAVHVCACLWRHKITQASMDKQARMMYVCVSCVQTSDQEVLLSHLKTLASEAQQRQELLQARLDR